MWFGKTQPLRSKIWFVKTQTIALIFYSKTNTNHYLNKKIYYGYRMALI